MADLSNYPENALYNVSSPTKTVEYYAVGLPAQKPPRRQKLY